MTDKFEQALIAAGRIVESWPSWKQNSLLVTSMATNSAPRKPVESPKSIEKREDTQFPITNPE
jgi:hypothetical protein